MLQLCERALGRIYARDWTVNFCNMGKQLIPVVMHVFFQGCIGTIGMGSDQE